ncbi:MAG: hypothetical protein KOO63_12560 [Bacteroidales bacterium]|nr:hypothetical protein [Candidatus Latescibacterota bacterium]
MKEENRQIVFLGRHWPETAELVSSSGRRVWMDHYASHKSFPVPGAGKGRNGRGVIIVDCSDFEAVQASHSYEGEWLIVAYLPDVYSMNVEYETRLLTEARIYGGLRDLELRVVGRADASGTLFVLDNPGGFYSQEMIVRMAETVWILNDKLEEPLQRLSRWPECCRTLGIYQPEDKKSKVESDDTASWERIPPVTPGEEYPEEVRRAMSPARLKVPSEETVFHAGNQWLSIGVARTLSDFTISGIYYESFKRVLNDPLPAWPEPGDTGADPRKGFMKKYGKTVKNRPQVLDKYFDSLARRTAPDRADISGKMPEFVMRWLGLSENGGEN